MDIFDILDICIAIILTLVGVSLICLQVFGLNLYILGLWGFLCISSFVLFCVTKTIE